MTDLPPIAQRPRGSEDPPEVQRAFWATIYKVAADTREEQERKKRLAELRAWEKWRSEHPARAWFGDFVDAHAELLAWLALASLGGSAWLIIQAVMLVFY